MELLVNVLKKYRSPVEWHLSPGRGCVLKEYQELQETGILASDSDSTGQAPVE